MRLFIMLCLAIISIPEAYACDACGCTTSSSSVGLLTDYRRNFIRLYYYETHFESMNYHGPKATDRFITGGIGFRYSFTKYSKLRISGNLPFKKNIITNEDEERSIKGLSDINTNLHYALLDHLFLDGYTSLYIEVGFGINFPTGAYNKDIVDDKLLPQNYNLGTGAWGYVLQSNIVLNNKQNGIVLNSTFQLNDETSEGYHFGHQFVNQLTLYHKFILPKFDIIPNFGLLYENIFNDKYRNGNAVPETGGQGLFLSSAINFKSKSWLAGCSLSIPINEEYAGGVIQANNKFTIQISYLF